MPARTRKVRHDDLTRERIQTSQLVNRLTNHVLGKAEMSATQVRAAEILLNKSLPNLQTIENNVSGNLGYTAIPVAERDALDASNRAPEPSDPPPSRH